jgi:uncharacterized protein
MRFAADSNPGVNLIRAYAPGTLTINDAVLHSSVSLSASTLQPLPALRDASDLQLEHAEALLLTNPEIVLLGTGATQVFPGVEWRATFLTRAIGLEVMTTAAACRTYNVLAAEKRRVTALLIP